jgi:hypothetical protein
MLRRRHVVLLGLATACFSWFCSAPRAAAATLACDAARLQGALPSSLNVTLTSATSQSTPVTYCNVIGTIATSTSGEPGSVGFEIALPALWNGRFLFIGGGLAGSLAIQETDFPPALETGFATAITDAGHESELGLLAELDGTLRTVARRPAESGVARRLCLSRRASEHCHRPDADRGLLLVEHHEFLF